jgi:hypothetical protein
MAWLEATSFADWVRTSLIGYPLLLTLHSIGMAIMVGLIFVVNLRLLGFFKRIPYTSLDRMLTFAWIGFVINLVSGLGIFTSQATFYVTSGPFILKIAMVLLGALAAGYMLPTLKTESANWMGDSPVTGMMQTLAIGSLVIWTVAITTGRFTAYL